jgi:hypothetical protein
MHSVVHVNLHCRVASSHLHRPRANVERDVHFKKELDFLIYMRRLAAGVKPCQEPNSTELQGEAQARMVMTPGFQ